MPRVHKRTARADIYARGLRTDADNKQGYTLDRSKPANDQDEVIIKKGQVYFTWQLKGQSPRFKLTPPNRNELTQSEFMLSLYDLEDRLDGLNPSDREELEIERDSLVDDIRALSDEQDEKFNNMPEGLQQGDMGQLLEERRDGLSDWADELENVDLDFDGDTDDDDEVNFFIDEKVCELAGISHSL